MSYTYKFITRFTVYLLLLFFVPNLFFTSATCASASQELTEKDAVTLIRKHAMFDITWNITIYTKEIHMSIQELESSQPYYSALKALELIELRNPTLETADGRKTRTDRTIVSFTEKGRLQSKDWQQPRENEWVITVAVREFLEAVKFYNDQHGFAYVEFFWTYTTNKIGEAMGQQFRKEKALAYFKFNEGAWQITRIRAAS